VTCIHSELHEELLIRLAPYTYGFVPTTCINYLLHMVIWYHTVVNYVVTAIDKIDAYIDACHI
jgi:hypothetical protein